MRWAITGRNVVDSWTQTPPGTGVRGLDIRLVPAHPVDVFPPLLRVDPGKRRIGHQALDHPGFQALVLRACLALPELAGTDLRPAPVLAALALARVPLVLEVEPLLGFFRCERGAQAHGLLAPRADIAGAAFHQLGFQHHPLALDRVAIAGEVAHVVVQRERGARVAVPDFAVRSIFSQRHLGRDGGYSRL